MPMILRQVLRVVIGLVCGLFWVLTVASVASGAPGNDYGLAMIAGNVVGIVLVDRWIWWARGFGVFLAGLLGSVGAVAIWDALPWKSGDWMGYGYWAWLLSAASVGLWWVGWGYRLDKPPADDTNGGGGPQR